MKANIKPTTKVYDGDRPTEFAVSLNDRRRHMSTGALSAVGVDLLPHLEADAKKRKSAGGGDKKSPAATKSVSQKVEQPIVDHNEGKSIEIAAKSVGVNRQYIADAKKVKEKCPDVFEKMKAGKISLQDAKREVAKKPTDDWRPDERKRQKIVEAGKSVLANAERDKNLICWAESKGVAVRIDRGTRFGNPFILDEDGDRDYVCDAYCKHYLKWKKSIKKRIEDLVGKVLICHCYPERCHGDALLELIEGGE